MWTVREPYRSLLHQQIERACEWPRARAVAVAGDGLPEGGYWAAILYQRGDGAAAAARPVTSRAVPCLVMFRNILATPPSTKRPIPAVYLIPSCSKPRSSCPRRLGGRWRVTLGSRA